MGGMCLLAALAVFVSVPDLPKSSIKDEKNDFKKRIGLSSILKVCYSESKKKTIHETSTVLNSNEHVFCFDLERLTIDAVCKNCPLLLAPFDIHPSLRQSHMLLWFWYD